MKKLTNWQPGDTVWFEVPFLNYQDDGIVLNTFETQLGHPYAKIQPKDGSMMIDVPVEKLKATREELLKTNENGKIN